MVIVKFFLALLFRLKSMLVKPKLVGFNNPEYDNHILYGRMLGYSNFEADEMTGVAEIAFKTKQEDPEAFDR